MKHRNKYPTQKELLSLFNYNEETGDLTWKVTRGSIKKGTLCNYNNGRGYLRTRIDKKQFLNHIIIYIMMTGEEPKFQIDHDDGNTLNNKWDNLIQRTQSENIRKAKLKSDNTSGYKGVSWNLKRNKWESYITINKKRKFLGYFNDIVDAINSRVQAEMGVI